MTDYPNEFCGVFGIYAPGEDVARITFFGLYALQHRGQESAGIATSTGRQINLHTAMGLVSQVFDEDDLAGLKGSIAVGHNRYSTTGSSRIVNAQPILVEGELGPLALAHNGNIVNAAFLRAQLEEEGCAFHGSTDAEVIAHLFARSEGADWTSRILRAMSKPEGAFSLVLMTREQLIGLRDPLGMRPLCLGKLDGGWVLASESCALDTVGARFIREIEPGEMVAIDSEGVHSYLGQRRSTHALCIFEYIYFARPDSVLNGRLVYLARRAMGAALAREYPVEADLVIAVPDSALAASIGHSRESGLPFSEGLLKNRYIGRTFIQPDQRIRDTGVQLKFNPLVEVLAGKRVVVVDDTIVRGTTTPRVVALLRKAGVKEVHLRICAPPIRHPCFFGVDTARYGELLAAHKTVEEITAHVGADTLGYLSLGGLLGAVGLPGDQLCQACFTGLYPLPVQLEMDKLVFERPASDNGREGESGVPRSRDHHSILLPEHAE